MAQLWKFLKNGLWCGIVLAAACSDYGHPGTDPADIPTATVVYAGVRIEFGYVPDLMPTVDSSICFYNQNDTVIRLRVKNKTRSSTLIDDTITFGGNANCRRGASFLAGDLITMEVWIGTSSIYNGTVHGAAADAEASFTLGEGMLTVTPGSALDSFTLTLPSVRGVSCILSGQYDPATPYDQRNQLAVCTNASSNSVRFQLYALAGSGSPYSYSYEVMGGTILEPLGETMETSGFMADIVPGGAYALRAYNVSLPLGSPVSGTEQTIIMTLNVQTGTVTILSGATASLPAPS